MLYHCMMNKDVHYSKVDLESLNYYANQLRCKAYIN